MRLATFAGVGECAEPALAVVHSKAQVPVLGKLKGLSPGSGWHTRGARARTRRASRWWACARAAAWRCCPACAAAAATAAPQAPSRAPASWRCMRARSPPRRAASLCKGSHLAVAVHGSQAPGTAGHGRRGGCLWLVMLNDRQTCWWPNMEAMSRGRSTRWRTSWRAGRRASCRGSASRRRWSPMSWAACSTRTRCWRR